MVFGDTPEVEGDPMPTAKLTFFSAAFQRMLKTPIDTFIRRYRRVLRLSSNLSSIRSKVVLRSAGYVTRPHSGGDAAGTPASS